MGLKRHLKRAERQLLRPLGRLLRVRGRTRPQEALLLERLERAERRLEALEALIREDLGLRYLQADPPNPGKRAAD